MESLSDISAMIKPVERPTVEVDITPFLPISDPDRRIVLHWSRPTIDKLYGRLATIPDLIREFPAWNLHLAVEVANVAACHEAPSPGGKSVGMFYADIVNSGNDRLWQFLEAERTAHFPNLSDVDASTLKKILLVQAAQDAPAIPPTE